jgi:methylase of polypeptide subunit release factors
LIGFEFVEEHKGISSEELKRVNPFDWNTEFPEAMLNGGFDVLVGNPPYIRIQTMKEWAPLEVEDYKQQYVSANKGNYDIYVVFVEKGLSLLNEHGRLDGSGIYFSGGGNGPPTRWPGFNPEFKRCFSKSLSPIKYLV